MIAAGNRCLMILLLSIFVLPAMAAQSCNSNVTAVAPNSRYVDPGASKVQCWGGNTYGQLGNGSTTQYTKPVLVTGLSTAVVLSAGNSHSCALRFDGTIECWGLNANGQLGDGTTTDSTIPVVVNGISSALDLAAGNDHNCARLDDGSVQCWGLNDNGQLGDGTTTQADAPVAVSGLTTATAVAAGASHSCALLSNGSVECWGLNSNGQLGNGGSTQSNTPVAVIGIPTNTTPPVGAIAIAAGGAHSCALLSDNTIECWGLNDHGQLGNNSTANQFITPVIVSGIHTANAISAGVGYSCALLANGTVQCWGLNANGQLGNGGTTDSRIPVNVSGFISPVVAIASGGSHSCALLSNGKINCWGLNANGQLGNGTTADSSTPVVVSGINDAAAIAGGNSHSCARISSGTSTVVDTSAGLMWKRCSEGQAWDLIKEACVGDPKTFTWQEALQRVKDVNLGNLGYNLGLSDWRLPNRNELTSLVEYKCDTPAINASIFPGTGEGPYWSSSPDAAAAGNAWNVDFLDGKVSGAPKTSGFYVRLIRGGK